MPRIDVEAINKNREVMANSTIDSPYEAHIEDSDSDYAEQLYGQLPPDHVGFMEGSLTDTRRRRNGT